MTSKEPTTVFRAHSISCDLGVAACVVIDDKILLVKEAVGKHAGRWGAPKGYADSDGFSIEFKNENRDIRARALAYLIPPGRL